MAWTGLNGIFIHYRGKGNNGVDRVALHYWKIVTQSLACTKGPPLHVEVVTGALDSGTLLHYHLISSRPARAGWPAGHLNFITEAVVHQGKWLKITLIWKFMDVDRKTPSLPWWRRTVRGSGAGTAIFAWLWSVQWPELCVSVCACVCVCQISGWILIEASFPWKPFPYGYITILKGV